MHGQNAKRWRPRQETRLAKRNEAVNSRIALAKRRPYNRLVPDDVPENENHPTQLLRRSLANGRLGHAYLFVGGNIESLESHAIELARAADGSRRYEVGVHIADVGHFISPDTPLNTSLQSASISSRSHMPRYSLHSAKPENALS